MGLSYRSGFKQQFEVWCRVHRAEASSSLAFTQDTASMAEEGSPCGTRRGRLQTGPCVVVVPVARGAEALWVVYLHRLFVVANPAVRCSLN